MNKYSNIKCLFYKAHPQLQVDYVLQDANTILLKGDELIDKVWDKTLKVFEIVEPLLSQFDYVFRPNLSSFVHFPRLCEFLQTLPRTNCCAALPGKHEGIRFPEGAAFTLSPDLVRRFVKERPPLICQDDVSIGKALETWGIPIQPATRYDILVKQQHEILNPSLLESPYYHFRLKDHFERRNDMVAYKALLKLYYGIYVE